MDRAPEAGPPVVAERVPGACPFAPDACRSVHTGYAEHTGHAYRPWTRPLYTGLGTAAEANARYRQLIANGTTALSVAFDLPTRTGHDSDAPIASGEVGRAGVAIDSLDDMRVLFRGIPLDEVRTTMTIGAPAAPLLLMYQLVAEEQGVAARRLRGTIECDVLEEYLARGTRIFPPEPSLRLSMDVFRYCRAEIPRWNSISVSGRHLAAAGATPAQEIAFTLADGIEYVRTAVAAGIDVDDFAPRLSFSLAPRTTESEELAGYRAARRIWARVLRAEFGAKKPESLAPRFHTRAVRAVPAARRPVPNPSRAGAQAPVRVTDVTGMVDPFSGACALEKMTDDIEAAARALMARVEALGGAVGAVEFGFQKSEIERSAYRTAPESRDGERVPAGADGCRPDEEEPYEFLRLNPAIEMQQAERMAKSRAWRCHERVGTALTGMQKAAAGTGNVLYPMKGALAAGATVGEVCDALREVWGTYTPRNAF